MGTTGAVIVAIPAVDDYVWNISSEKVPHLTLLYLGEEVPEDKLKLISEFLEHAADVSIRRFGLSVDRRDSLGEHDADVVFFDKSYNIRELNRLRFNLLQNSAISEAYNSATQFESWTPHLTLGYPETPAKPDEREYPGLHWISFDRLAIWTGEYDGPEFRLEEQFDLEVAMSSTSTLERGLRAVSELFHHGVKGQKWGVRKRDSSPVDTTVSQKRPGTRVTAKGGENQPASDDAKKAASTARKAKASTVDSLSNQELQDLVRRMNLEAQYTQLSANRESAGAKFIKKLFYDASKKQASAVFNEQADAYGRQVNKALSDKLTKD